MINLSYLYFWEGGKFICFSIYIYAENHYDDDSRRLKICFLFYSLVVKKKEKQILFSSSIYHIEN